MISCTSCCWCEAGGGGGTDNEAESGLEHIESPHDSDDWSRDLALKVCCVETPLGGSSVVGGGGNSRSLRALVGLVRGEADVD